MLRNDIKDNLGISHCARDNEIDRRIIGAKAELERVGVPNYIANDETNVLIHDAIISGVCSIMHSNEKMRTEFKELWLTSKDELRKHDWGE